MFRLLPTYGSNPSKHNIFTFLQHNFFDQLQKYEYRVNQESLNDVVDAIPKLYPVLYCVDGSFEDDFVFWVLSCCQFVHQLLGQGTVFLAVDLDVTLEVEFQELTAVVLREGVHESLEHLGNRVLSSVEELRGDVRNGLVQAADGVRDEVLDVVWNFALVECIMNSGSLSESLDKVLNNGSVSINLLHGLDVQLKMRSVAVSIGMDISFLTQDDFIDKPCSAPRGRWQPNRVNTCKIPLKSLKQQHEVPNSKDMCLHKDLNLSLMVNSLIDLMTVQGLLKGLKLSKASKFLHRLRNKYQSQFNKFWINL